MPTNACKVAAIWEKKNETNFSYDRYIFFLHWKNSLMNFELFESAKRMSNTKKCGLTTSLLLLSISKRENKKFAVGVNVSNGKNVECQISNSKFNELANVLQNVRNIESTKVLNTSQFRPRNYKISNVMLNNQVTYLSSIQFNALNLQNPCEFFQFFFYVFEILTNERNFTNSKKNVCKNILLGWC